MILRLRSRDGLERINVPDTATVGDLRMEVHRVMSLPLEDITLSKDPNLLTSKTPSQYRDLSNVKASLKSLGFNHGDMLYLLYHAERQVQPAFRKSLLDSRKFGEHITINDVLSKQTRIERQDKAKVELASVDRQAGDAFQKYLREALAFSIKRGGIAYGNIDEEKNQVTVDFIYEPPQEGSATSLKMQRNTKEEEQVDFLAGLVGLKKVGIVFSQSTTPRDYIFSTEEVMMAAAAQDEMGEYAVTILVTIDSSEEGGGQVHFEAFQCTRQCVELVKDGWLVPQGDKPTGITKMINPKEPKLELPVIVAGKDASEVDNDWFLCAVSIADHDSKFTTSFPVENRLTPQSKSELRDHLRRGNTKSYVEKLSDMHLLLWLSKLPNLDSTDMMLLCDAVKEHKPVREGYREIIDSIAGL